MSMYTANLTPHVYDISSDTVADGDYDFDVGRIHEPLPFFLDGTYFVNASGDLVTPTGGTVTVSVSSDDILYREVVNATFNASSDPRNITPPSGQAPVIKLRITLSGITGAEGFRSKFVKGGE